MSAKIEITTENFESEVAQSDVPVLLDFWAEWCMPCKMVEPIVEELAGAYDGKLKVGSVDVDAEPDLAGRFNVMSIPTLIVFNKGSVAVQRVGALPRDKVEAMFKDLL